MSPNTIRLFFSNFGYEPDKEYKPISYERCCLAVNTAEKWFNRIFAKFIAGCFVGVELNPNGSYSKYKLEYPDKEEIDEFCRLMWHD